MKVATFNVWNNNDTWALRKEIIIHEIMRIDADIIALQEVPNLEELESILNQSGIEHYSFKRYPGDEEGLAVLSKYPIEEVMSENDVLSNCSMRVIVRTNGFTMGLTNVHLYWKSALVREKEIMEVVKWITESENTDYEFLCGDFNSTPNLSSIYNFLVGELSIESYDTSWIDLAQSEKSPTLDFTCNSWLLNRENLNHIRVPVRYDWILLRSCYPKKEPKLLHIELFGNVVSPAQQVYPSDHYGVLVDLSL
ncbi:endonuclease/exonuclease/phosphatase family protein [Bacillus sp. E(2018)]|uniref:endonuclease/exonuclease/phosphatase family protein n=1 Tax=Bacillus sp. E(2018) TaxID=2502239 RepID=UPI00257108CE|nr:endonuclease/exonuclease/phosphatase family protein [Bacillus sp. E(2018)]